MNYIIITYSFYLLISICLTVWVARTLFKNGKLFLVDIFHGNKELADSVNNLLLVGFYLINLGYAVYTLQVTGSILNVQQVIEELSIKIGLIILILGAMHFFNLYIFFNLRKKALNEKHLKDRFVHQYMENESKP
jgi:uncharacterized BrkB/YihY/UPF0761 family membrane protein